MNISLMQIGKQPFRWIRRKYESLGTHHCYVCKKTLRRFRPYQDGQKSFSPFILELQCIGSDVENFSCPFCGCHDRERHLFMYFDRLELWHRIEKSKVLHFAPEAHLSRRISELNPVSYVKADLFPSSSEIQRIDITQIPFDDNTFDMVICNHVLEHVPDDTRALMEISRILRPGGLAILQTPYSNLLQNSFFDPAVCTDELRTRFYGQKDHVRIYGRDLFSKIEQAGFALKITAHHDLLSDIDDSAYGVNPDENLILVMKHLQTIYPQSNECSNIRSA